MELFDTHCHLTFGQLSSDVEAVLDRSRRAGVTRWVTVGTDPDESRAAVEVAERFENVYAAVGIHPHEARDVTREGLRRMEAMAAGTRVVAIGETGLDFHYDHSPRPEQRRAFVQQLEIAKAVYLPVIIHSREAFDETLDILEQHETGLKRVVFHCFGGDAEQARELVKRGYYVSFTGVVTFKNAEAIREAAAAVPVERMMVETDCPYMSPEPMRKQKVNEPALMVHTAGRLAEIKGMELEEFAAAVTQTSKYFFDIPEDAH